MHRWTALVFVLCLVGCSSASTLPAQRIHEISQAKIGGSGGSFSGSYSGTWTGDGSDCTAHGDFHFSGNGSGLFIHHSTESGLFLNGDFGCSFGGSVRLTSKFNPANTITANLAPFRGAPPCGNLIGYGITGGTGKFAHASGKGRFKLICNNDKTYTNSWSGTLNF